jgi:hypothetical protein
VSSSTSAFSLISSVRDANRIPVKLKLVIGTYIFQANRANFNQNKVDATCLLCNAEDEDMEHFLLRCSVLDELRNSTFHDMDITTYNNSRAVVMRRCFRFHMVTVLKWRILSTF